MTPRERAFSRAVGEVVRQVLREEELENIKNREAFKKLGLTIDVHTYGWSERKYG